MSKTNVEFIERISWEELRRRSSLLGIPAWKLAEELAVHGVENQFVSKTSLNK